MIGDRLERDWTAPPYDALAEAIILRGLLYRPASIAEYDPSMLLVFPEHRQILTAMKRAYAANPGQEWGRFYSDWMDQCEVVRPGHGAALVALLDNIDDDQARLTDGDPWGRHDFLWSWQRLKDVVESRRIVGVLHTAQERAWHGDIDGARKAVQSVRQPAHAAIRIDIA